MIAGGIFHFLEEAQVKQFFSMLAGHFPEGEIVFNAMSRSDDGFGAWMDIYPPEQRDAMRAAMTEALKEWWEKAPRNHKNKLNDMIATLTVPTKPKGKEWSDLEVWWNELSAQEKEEAWRGLMTAFQGGLACGR